MVSALYVSPPPAMAESGPFAEFAGTWSGSVREALMTYTAPFNMAGFPAITIPLPSDRTRLPAGLQIVARPGDDGALLQIAQQRSPPR